MYIYIYIYIHTYLCSDQGEILQAPEIARVRLRWRVPLNIHWTIPVEIRWESDNALENTAEK